MSRSSMRYLRNEKLASYRFYMHVAVIETERRQGGYEDTLVAWLPPVVYCFTFMNVTRSEVSVVASSYQAASSQYDIKQCMCVSYIIHSTAAVREWPE